MLYEYQGVWSALLGVLATVIVTLILNRVGKIYVYPLDIKRSYRKDSPHYKNRLIYEKNRDLATGMRYSFKVDLYNNTDILKGYRDVRICFLDVNDEIIKEAKVYDFDNREESDFEVTNKFAKLEFLNLPPKMMIRHHLYCEIRDDKFNDYKEFCKSICLKCKNHKGKEIRFKIELIEKFKDY